MFVTCWISVSNCVCYYSLWLFICRTSIIWYHNLILFHPNFFFFSKSSHKKCQAPCESRDRRWQFNLTPFYHHFQLKYSCLQPKNISFFMIQDWCLYYVLGPHIRENVQSTSFLVSKGKWRSPNFHVCYKKYDRLAFFYEFNKVNFEVLTKLAHIVITEIEISVKPTVIP